MAHCATRSLLLEAVPTAHGPTTRAAGLLALPTPPERRDDSLMATRTASGRDVYRPTRRYRARWIAAATGRVAVGSLIRLVPASTSYVAFSRSWTAIAAEASTVLPGNDLVTRAGSVTTNGRHRGRCAQ